MDIFTAYSLIVSGVFFAIALGCAVYTYSLQTQIHNERQMLARERQRLGDEVLNILKDSAQERKDLYDRIQAGTLSQYKEHIDAPNEVETDEEEAIVDLEDAKEDIING